jgi:hypothetical protein
MTQALAGSAGAHILVDGVRRDRALHAVVQRAARLRGGRARRAPAPAVRRVRVVAPVVDGQPVVLRAGAGAGAAVAAAAVAAVAAVAPALRTPAQS